MQAGNATLQFILQQVIGEAARAALPANRLTGVVQHLAVEQRLFTDDDIVGVGIEIDITWIVADQQRGHDRLAQAGHRIGTRNGFDSNVAAFEVDMAAGVIVVAVFDVIFRSGDQDFVDTPNVLDVMRKLAH